MDGLLPDNQAVRERWGATYGVSANNPFALLRQVGRDAAGAVQILPAEAASTDAAQHSGDIGWLTDEQFVALIRDLAEHRTDWNPGRYTGRWSLAGAPSKVAPWGRAQLPHHDGRATAQSALPVASNRLVVHGAAARDLARAGIMVAEDTRFELVRA